MNIFHDPRTSRSESINLPGKKYTYQSVVTMNGYPAMHYYEYILQSKDRFPLYPAPSSIQTFNFPASAPVFVLRNEPMYHQGLQQDGQFSPIMCVVNGLPRDQYIQATTPEEKWKQYRDLWCKMVFVGVTRLKFELDDVNSVQQNIRAKTIACICYGDATFVNASGKECFPGCRLWLAIPNPDHGPPVHNEAYEAGACPVFIEPFEPEIFSRTMSKMVNEYFAIIVNDIDKNKKDMFECSGARIATADIGNVLLRYGFGFSSLVIRRLFYKDDGGKKDDIPSTFKDFIQKTEYASMGFGRVTNMYPYEQIKYEKDQKKKSNELPFRDILQAMSSKEGKYASDLDTPQKYWKKLTDTILCGMASMEDQLEAHTVGYCVEHTQSGQNGLMVIRK